MTSRGVNAGKLPAADATPTMDAEPVGIVISQGNREKPVPAVWAYVWGTAPESARRTRKPRAA